MKVEMKLYKRNDGYSLRTIMGRHMLFPVGESTQNFQGAVILNDIAAMLWDMMNSYVTIDELVKKVTSEYDAVPSQVKVDIQMLLDMLISNLLIEEVETEI